MKSGFLVQRPLALDQAARHVFGDGPDDGGNFSGLG
jgi:hypothetical protein